MISADMVQQNLVFLNTETRNVIAYTLNGNVNGDSWKDILVIFNGNRGSARINIPQNEWTLAVHDGVINLNGIALVKDTLFTVAPSSASILYR
jgi:pullulanase